MIILIRLLGYLVAIVASWVLVLALPCWLLGLADCRGAAYWSPHQKIKGYVTMKSPRLAALLISRWAGYNERLHRNVPLLNNQFWLNPHPVRLALLGLVDWCFTLPLLGWYLLALTRFYIERPPGGGNLPLVLLILLMRTLVMHLVTAWNSTGEQLGVVMTRKERRQWKRAYRWAKKER